MPQLHENLCAVGWSLTPDQVKALEAASAGLPPYPRFMYRTGPAFALLNPSPV